MSNGWNGGRSELSNIFTGSRNIYIEVTSAFAEFERKLIQQRIHAGLKRAVEQGKTLGRPRTDDKTESAIRRHLQGGAGIRKTAGIVGVGVGTVQRVKAEMAAG